MDKWSGLRVIIALSLVLFTFHIYESPGEEGSQRVGFTKDESVVLSRAKRYALEGSRWRVNEVTYKISKYSDKLPKETVDKIIRKAFNIWAKASNLKFTQKKSGKVHIEIRFEHQL